MRRTAHLRLVVDNPPAGTAPDAADSPPEPGGRHRLAASIHAQVAALAAGTAAIAASTRAMAESSATISGSCTLIRDDWCRADAKLTAALGHLREARSFHERCFAAFAADGTVDEAAYHQLKAEFEERYR